MLQLPTTTDRVRHFTKAEIADITRNAKAVKVRHPSAKSDPIIATIKRADRAMEKWIRSRNDVYFAKQRLDTQDCGFVVVHPIDEPAILREFGHGFVFTSESHVVKLFKLRRKQARQRISQTRAMMVQSEDRCDTLNIELKQRIIYEQKLIADLLKFEQAQRKAVSAEARRLHRVQKAAGLLVARKEQATALSRLCSLTEKISKLKPINRNGALAAIDYVGKRLFPDRVDFFMHGTLAGSNFWELLRDAYKVLEQDRLLEIRRKTTKTAR